VALLAALVVLSVVGAFLGAQRAGELFNSVPMAAYWVVLACLLAAAGIALGQGRSKPFVLLMHLGGVLIIASAMYGADAGHRLTERLGAPHKARRGFVLVHEGQKSSALEVQDGESQLPFAVRLDRFVIDYHARTGLPWTLLMLGADQADRPIAVGWRLGKPVEAPALGLTVEAIQYLPHAAVATDGQAAAAPKPDSPDAAMEFILRRDGREVRGWLTPVSGVHGISAWSGRDVTAGWPEMAMVRPPPAPRQYNSQVTILADGQPARSATIAVNRPFHQGGYFLFQHAFGLDPQTRRPYTVLLAQSDRGVYPALAGLILLAAGAMGHFWLAPLWRGARTLRRPPAPLAQESQIAQNT
jgi:hypothetical protein